MNPVGSEYDFDFSSTIRPRAGLLKTLIMRDIGDQRDRLDLPNGRQV